MKSSKVSRRYAKALLSIGQENGQYKEYGDNLQDFTGFCAANSEFFNVVSSQIFSIEDRKKIVESVLEKSSFADIVKNFLRLLLEKNRIGEVKFITDYYLKLTDEISNITRSTVLTARPLSQETLDKLVTVLTGLVSKKIEMEVKEDASLMGGIVVQIGDLVLDGSVRTQLKGLKESLKRGEYN